MRYPREDTQPWYRQFWPWFIITPPLTGIMLGVVLVTAATHDPDGLIVGDYYKEGRGINQSIERVQFAESLGLSAQATVEENRVWIHLTSAVPIPPQELTLAFRHPTRDRKDRILDLQYDAGKNRYFADFGELRSAFWHMNLEPLDASWRLRGRMQELEATEVSLIPST